MNTGNVADDTGSNRMTNYRWLICALLFFSTTINYIDRNSLSVLKTTLQCDAALDRRRLRLDHHGLYLRLRDVPFADRLLRRSVRRQEGARRSLDPVVSGGGGPWPGGHRDRIHDRALRAGPRRGCELPGFDQGRRDVVSAEGAGARYRPVQFGHQCRCHRLRCRRVGGDAVELADGLRVHRRHGSAVADLLAEVLRHAGEAGACQPCRSRVHQGGPAARGGNREGALAGAAALSRDLAVPHRQVPHRSGVVVLSILVAGLPGARAWPGCAQGRLLGGCDLRGFVHRLDSRRLAVGHISSSAAGPWARRAC